tara:strand:+ start:98 stop:304 length:207 start_codon:yes stop_codon:yes gene_type:complete
MEDVLMGKMSDLLISGASNEEMNAMIDNARSQHTEGYIQFLESQLEKAEKKVEELKVILMDKQEKESR